MDRVEALKHCRVLSGFTDVGLQILAAVTRERYFPNAQAIQVQGELPRDAGVLFLVSGRARCEVRNTEEQTLGLGSLAAGEHLGAMRLFGEALSPLSVIAEGDVAALLLDRPAFERIQRQKPKTATKLLMALTADFGKHLGETSQLFADFAVFASVRMNIAERGQYASYAELGLDGTPTIGTGWLRRE